MKVEHVRRAAGAPGVRLPMKAHLEPVLGMSIGAVAGVLVALIIPAGQGWHVRLGVALDIALICALAHPWLIIFTSTPEQSRQRAAVDFPGRTTLSLIKLIVSVAGLGAAVWLLTASGRDAPAGETTLVLGLGLGAVAMAWLYLHASYTLRYAHMYYYEGGDAGGLQFPGDRSPDDMDFAYFAFTIGMTFQTSDTGVTTRTMRRAVLGHALLSFVFNTTIIALTVSLIAGRI